MQCLYLFSGTFESIFDKLFMEDYQSAGYDNLFWYSSANLGFIMSLYFVYRV